MEQKTCYVTTFFFGERRYNINKYYEDHLCYLKSQLECLEKYKHSLSKIVFVFNVDDPNNTDLTEAIKIIPKTIQNSEVDVIIRSNYGMSYGAWSDAFRNYMDKYDYYIFNEDDYVIVQDNFDEYLINKFNVLPSCGYLCGVVREGFNKHAGMSSGISSYECLKKIFDRYGELPHSKGKDYTSTEQQGQINQSHSLLEFGYNIYDIREDYRMRFWFCGYMDNYFIWNDKDFFLPAKIYYNEPHRVVNQQGREYLRMESNLNSQRYYVYL